jgi:hypothetical protein
MDMKTYILPHKSGLSLCIAKLQPQLKTKIVLEVLKHVKKVMINFFFRCFDFQ